MLDAELQPAGPVEEAELQPPGPPEEEKKEEEN